MTTATVAAVLTVLGYSIYDTIIVFDRVRENMPLMRRATFATIANVSLWETIRRSLATTFITLLPVASLLLFGGATLKDFAFALFVGIGLGARLHDLRRHAVPDGADGARARSSGGAPTSDVVDEGRRRHSGRGGEKLGCSSPARRGAAAARARAAVGSRRRRGRRRGGLESQSKRERRRQRRRSRPHGRAR